MRAWKPLGFTLIELTIIILVIGIIAAVLVPLWPGKKIELNAQASRFASDLRYTQHLATTRGERFQLLKLSNTSYRIQNINASPTIIDTVNLESGLSFSAFPNNVIAFGTDGTPYLTTTIPGTAMSANATFQMTDGTNTETITVSPETGKVTIS